MSQTQRGLSCLPAAPASQIQRGKTGRVAQGGISRRSRVLGQVVTAAATQIKEQPLQWADIEQHAGRQFLENGYMVRSGQQPGTAPHSTLPTQLAVESTKPVILYRDTNAWCPFCERTWLALLHKGIPFDVIFIDLRNKPDWYPELVPTKLVPAVRLASGEVVIESFDILKRLDVEFPERPLFPTDPALIKAAEAMVEAERPLSSAGYRFMTGKGAGGFGAGEKTPELLPQFQAEFAELLSGVDALLAQQGGPFFLGAEFSYVDAMYIPSMERFAANMPFIRGFHLRNNPAYPSISGWLEAMNALPAYQQVKSDDGTHHLLVSKFFGVEDRAEVIVDDVTVTARKEAAAKLNINREIVLRDILNRSGVVQDRPAINGYPPEVPPHIQEAVDFSLRRLASYLLTGKPGPKHETAIGRSIGAATLAYWRNRASSPRDMTAAATDEMRSACDEVLKDSY